MAESFAQLEADYIAHGKSYGFEGTELMEYVEKRLRDATERAERAERREIEKLREEYDTKLLAAEQENQSTGSRKNEHSEEFSGSPSLRRMEIAVPKYDPKQGVAAYLVLFEDVMEQNRYPVEQWLLRLRVALAGTRCEASCVGCSTYKEAKREILSAHGETAEKVWSNLLAAKQKEEESFHQFVSRLIRTTDGWLKQVLPKKYGGSDPKESAVDDSAVATALVKQIVVQAVSPEFRAFLLEKNCREMDLEVFRATGLSYQDAHGRRKTKGADPKPASQIPCTAECLGVSVEEAQRELGKLTPSERKTYVFKEKLCLNCLRTGHRVQQCIRRSQCKKCARKHHDLLHESFGEAATKIRVAGCSAAMPVHLMTGVAGVKGNMTARVRVFLDPGAQASFITSELVEAIKPQQIGTERLRVTGFGGEPKSEELNRFAIEVSGTSKPISVRAWEKDSLSLNFPCLSREAVATWKERGYALSDQPGPGTPETVHLLIGADYCNEFLIEKHTVAGETAWKTEIGWVLSGSTQAVKASGISVSCAEANVERLWKLEEVPEMTKCLPEFPVERIGNQYQVGLLWKGEERPSSNYAMAMATAQQLLKKLNKTDRRQLYDDVLIKEYLQLDAIELEPDPSTPGYVMPHHAVFRSTATTTKTRVVFNASASVPPAKSLNDLVDAGPSLLPDLTGVLIRFREYEHALQADIRKAFFMIGIREEDRPYLRFLWPEEGEKEICIWRLKKLPFGVNCSPFVLNAVLLHHLDSLLESADGAVHECLAILRDSFYVDDSLVSLPSTVQAEMFQAVSVRALSEAGMDLRKWRGNSIPCDPEAGDKALGIVWNTAADEVALASVSDIASPNTWSRRELLKCVASIFDPLGLAAPSVLCGKMLLQETWKMGGGWDDPLPEALQSRCSAWWGAMSDLAFLSVPRWLHFVNDVPVTLHVFADASEKGYGCCFYAVCGDVSSLLLAKAKVAPVSPPTLARLELQAVDLASRLLEFVASQLRVRVSRIMGWTDSLTTWHWITSPAYRWKTFVANRVARVQEVAKKQSVEWRHCPGSTNPADLVSRGVLPSELHSSMWFKGPDWLLSEEKWPQSGTAEGTQESAVEVRVVAAQVDKPAIPWSWENFSSWRRARGMVIRVLSWRHPGKSRAELSQVAEGIMISAIQEECFPEELASLKAGESLPKSSKLLSLSPFLDETGVLRVGGRLQQSELAYDAKHPIVLGKHPLLQLLLEKTHKERLHQGVESVLAFLRERFWIFSARRLLRSVSDKCFTCRWFRAEAAEEESPALPSDRVIHLQPFGMTGVDYAGPMFARNGKQRVKLWIALFVCGTTRAVHLEIVESLSTEAFLLAFRRFCARRGQPLRIRSDNATTFKAAADKLDIIWRFNPPAAPWHGGFYERLVGCVKRPLKKVLGKASLHLAELTTILVEIEAVVNARPLTPVSTDLADEPPLTPAMMIGSVFRPGVAEDELALDREQLSARMQYLNAVQKHVKQRWQSEYLVSLRAYHQSKSTPVKVGDVVLLADDTKKRHLWKLARIEELYPGNDGKCRVAKVRIGQGTMLRPIQRLVPLEVTASTESSVQSETPVSPSAGSEPVASDDADQADPVEVAVVPEQSVRRSHRVRRAPVRVNM